MQGCRSGDDIWDEVAFQLDDHVLQGKLPFLEALQLKKIDGLGKAQLLDNIVHVTVLASQLDQFFAKFFFFKHFFRKALVKLLQLLILSDNTLFDKMEMPAGVQKMRAAPAVSPVVSRMAPAWEKSVPGAQILPFCFSGSLCIVGASSFF